MSVRTAATLDRNKPPPATPAPGGGGPTASPPALLELGRILGRLMAEEDLEAMLTAKSG
ncbi:MAG: hypothetical protein HY055_03285 [Magnetospirillum sp.]|nr:hypothetical protein [Magnetospirillum sp.]